MEKKIKGYKLKPNLDVKDAVKALLPKYACIDWENPFTNIQFISILRNAGVLDIWFDPIYELEFPNFDVSKWLAVTCAGNRIVIGRMVQFIHGESDSSSWELKIRTPSGETFLYSEWTGHRLTDIRHATKDEILDAFCEEAEKRGYKPKMKVKPLSWGSAKEWTIGRLDEKHSFYENKPVGSSQVIRDVFYFYDTAIWSDGWAEIINEPTIIVRGYTAEFFPNYVKLGCAEIDNDVFLALGGIIDRRYLNSNRNLNSVTIGLETFTVEQIQEIAKHIRSKRKPRPL